MEIIYQIIYKIKVKLAKKNITPKKILKLMLFSFKHNIHEWCGLCYTLACVICDLDEPPSKYRWNAFKGFTMPKHEGPYWWPIDDRKSRIEFLKDLIAKQDLDEEDPYKEHNLL